MEQVIVSNAVHGTVECQLNEHRQRLEQLLKADVLVFVGPIIVPADMLIRDALEGIDAKNDRAVVLLETTGGYIEVAKRMADALRHHYGHVEFFIPNFAMSAGTVLVMSGDAIHMDYFSILGPIDPQVPKPDGTGLVPALGYLIQYQRLIEKSKKGELTSAELAYMIKNFDQAALYSYEQAREQSISLLKEWLVEYKFKNWEKTETRGIPVTHDMKVQRAEKVANCLNDTELWHSHSRGISMDVLRKTVELHIEDFGQNADLKREIRSYHRLLSDFLRSQAYYMVVHSKSRFAVEG